VDSENKKMALGKLILYYLQQENEITACDVIFFTPVNRGCKLFSIYVLLDSGFRK
jgi:hypothetical protein